MKTRPRYRRRLTNWEFNEEKTKALKRELKQEAKIEKIKKANQILRKENKKTMAKLLKVIFRQRTRQVRTATAIGPLTKRKTGYLRKRSLCSGGDAKTLKSKYKASEEQLNWAAQCWVKRKIFWAMSSPAWVACSNWSVARRQPASLHSRTTWWCWGSLLAGS